MRYIESVMKIKFVKEKEKIMKKTFSSLVMGVLLIGGAVQTANLVSAEAQTGDTGLGEAKVTYNVNEMNPEIGTDPDFVVNIPSSYNLSDDQQVVKGSISLKDKKDRTKAYVGSAEIEVKVTSASNFTFANGGQYKIVDDTNALVWDDTKTDAITLKAGNTDKVLNAQLKKKADSDKENIAGADKLTFTYTVK